MQDNKRHEPRHNTNINNQSTPNYLTRINQFAYPLKSLTPKLTGNFQKASSTCNINTSGSQPIIMFKKEKKDNFEFEFKKKMINQQRSQDDKYISDGGLKKKLEKYNSSSSQGTRNFQKGIKSPNNKSKNVHLEQKMKENFLQRQKKIYLDEQKLFSKTVRESNKRPVFPKNKGTNNNTDKECFKTKTNFGVNINNNNLINKNNNSKNSGSQKHIHGNKSNGAGMTSNNNIKNNNNIEDSKEQEERKILYMNQLVENAVVGELKQYNKVKKPSRRDLVVERKKEKIREVNEDFDEDLNEEINAEELLKLNEEIKEEENTTGNNNHGNVNTNITNNTNNTNKAIISHLNSNNDNKTNYNNHFNNTVKFSRPNGPVRINNYINSFEGTQPLKKTKKKKIMKPSVNQFEFLDRIKNEQRKLPVYSEFHKKSMSQDMNYNLSNLSSSKSHPNLNLNDSFRRKNPNLNIDNINNIEEIKNNNINNNERLLMKNNYLGNYNYNKSNENKILPSSNSNSNNNYFYKDNTTTESVQKTYEDGGPDDFPYAHKKSHRSKKELKQFVKEKRIKDKQDEERKLLEKNKKLFLLFKNLHNLNIKDVNYNETGQYQNLSQTPSQSQTQFPSTQLPSQTQQQQQLPSYQNYQKTKQQKTSSNEKSNRSNRTNNNSHINRSNSNTNNSNCLRKKKEINEYYIGSDATIKNNSTLIDPNEYYLNVLESQQLLVNSGLKRIENETDSSEEKKSILEVETTNEINPKEKIQRITDKESKRFNDSSSKKNSFLNTLNTNNYEELKEKIDYTLKRANEVFSKDNLRKYVNNLTTSSLNDNNKDNLESENENNENMENDNNNNENLSNENKTIEKKSTENNNINNENSSNKKKKPSKNQENQKLKPNSPEINIEASNTDNKVSKSGMNTKEGPLPSLTHTYSTNSNPNKKVEIEMEPKNVLNLVEILKFIIQRRVFISIYENYINDAMIQRYQLGLAYLVVICKQYQFRAIEKYCNYKTYHNIFRQLIRAFIRKNFKYFINNCYMRRKLEYLENLLTKIFKFKFLERLFIYSQFADGYEEKAFRLIITKIMSTLTRPHLKDVFEKLKNYQPNKKKPISFLDNMVNNINKIADNDDDSDEYNIYEKNNKNSKNQPIKSSKDKEIPSIESPESNNNIEKNPNLESKDSKDILDGRLQCEESYSNLNGSEDDNSSLHHRKDDNSIKMNSFMYNSEDDSKSSIKIEPNSFENDKLHQLKLMLMMRNNYMEDLEEEEEDDDGQDDNIIMEQNSESKNSLNVHQGFSHGRRGGRKNNLLSDLVDGENKSSPNKRNFLNQRKGERKRSDLDSDNDCDYGDDLKKSISSQGSKRSSKSKGSKGSKGKKGLNFLLNNNNNNSGGEGDDKNKKSEGKDSIKDNIKKKEEKEKEEKEKEENYKEKKDKIKDSINEATNEIKKTVSEVDISADNDTHNSIEWEYNISNRGDLKNDKEKDKDKDKKIEEVENNLNKKEELNNNKDNNNVITKSKESDIDEYANDFEIITDSDKEDEEKKAGTNENNSNNKNNDELNKNGNKNQEKHIISINNNNDNKKEELPQNKEKEKPIVESRNSNKKEDLIKPQEKKEKEIKEKAEQKEKEKGENDKIEKELEKEKEKIDRLKKLKDIPDPEKFTEDLTNLILSEKLIVPEIKTSKKKLIPPKKFKFDKFDKICDGQSNSLANSFSSVGNIRDNLSKEFGLGGSNMSHLSSLSDDLLSLNDSMMSQYTAHSIFNKTVKDKKKEHSLNLYFNLIAPKLIKIIKQEIYSKYDRIFANISSPMKNNSEKLMISLALQDAEMLRDNYKSSMIFEDIETILDKDNILKKFEKINKQIRSKDNVASDNFYDNMLNDCLIDTTIELINKERFYGKNGEPLKWSSRTHELAFKYKKNDPKKLADYVCKNLVKSLHNRIGLISDNYDYLSSDQINIERDRRLVDTIKGDLDENEYQWNNLEMEETQLKVESTELILDQLYNEVIEILEHIQFSRLRPDLYQHKSIYACEEIPKLSFQQTTTEDAGLVDAEDNVVI